MPRRVIPPAASPPQPPSRHVLAWWFGLMGAGGLGFGAVSERRPFGDDLFAHPLLVFFIAAGAGLLILRAALRRPVPDVIPDRVLLFGCVVGLVAFLVGNWLATHLVAPP